MRLSNFAAIAMLFASPPVIAQAQPSQPAQPPQSAQATQPAQRGVTVNGVDEFAQTAAQNNLTEVLLSTMALQKTNDKRVQDYAWTMLDHHARATGDLAEALSAGATALPTEPSAQQQAILQRMQGMEGTQFDQAFFAYQLDAHQQAISLFEQGERLADESVARYARATLPVLRAHQEITQIKQSEPPQPIPGQ